MPIGGALPHGAVAARLELTGAIARELHMATINEIAVTPASNAAFGRMGWRRRRVLLLGQPLPLTLDSQERVALLGHELGHGVNGDAVRGF
ncbi:MAG TPA: M48 family metalloprotease [Dehalococcoidia bacterium]|jgi:Zn-dependent protease with chaperone function